MDVTNKGAKKKRDEKNGQMENVSKKSKKDLDARMLKEDADASAFKDKEDVDASAFKDELVRFVLSVGVPIGVDIAGVITQIFPLWLAAINLGFQP